MTVAEYSFAQAFLDAFVGRAPHERLRERSRTWFDDFKMALSGATGSDLGDEFRSSASAGSVMQTIRVDGETDNASKSSPSSGDDEGGEDRPAFASDPDRVEPPKVIYLQPAVRLYPRLSEPGPGNSEDAVSARKERFRREGSGSLVRRLLGGEKSARNADLRGANFAGASLQGVNFDGARLVEAVFTSAHLFGSTFIGADLTAADLSEASMAGSDLRGAVLARANLQWAGLEDVNFEDAILQDASLEGARLTGANLANHNLRGVSLAGATLKWARLIKSSLKKADLTGADLSRTLMMGTNLQGARLVGANLRDADLADANMSDVDLSGCSVDGTIFLRAVLFRVNLANLDLRGANLCGALLNDAIPPAWSEAASVPERLRFDTHTTWPNALTYVLAREAAREISEGVFEVPAEGTNDRVGAGR